MLLFFTGITMPSAFTAIYFLLFICLCTWWAFHLPISHLGFNALCVMLSFFTCGHMLCLYLYQSMLAQALFPPHSLWARYQYSLSNQYVSLQKQFNKWINVWRFGFFISSSTNMCYKTFLFFPSRLFGLKDIVKPGNCSSPYELQLNVSYDWPVYVSPGILFLLYITLAAVLKTESHAIAHQVSLFFFFFFLLKPY